MRSIGEKLKKIRLENNLTMESLIERLNSNYGLSISKSMVSRWENSHSEPINIFVAAYAQEFGIDMNYLVGISQDDSHLSKSNLRKNSIPLYNSIACGDLTFIDEDIIGHISLPYLNDNHFAQRAFGDSMNGAGITSGDILVFEKTNVLDNGDIGAFCIDGECSCKRFKKIDGIIILQPENGEFDPIIVTEDKDFRVIGKLKRVIKEYD